MKKMIAMLLAALLVLSMAACNNGGENETTAADTTAAVETTTAPEETTVPEETTDAAEDTTAPAEAEGNPMETMANEIIALQPVEFMGGFMPVDLSDTSDDGLWAVKYYTGLDSAEEIKNIAVYEPMMGSIAFSMVLVQVNDAAQAQTVAEQMKNGIDTRKWICVEADELMVTGCGDTVMLIMLDSSTGLTAQAFVDAFQSVSGAELDFTI